MIQFHFADEPIAGRSRFHANGVAMRAIFLDIEGGPKWLRNSQATGSALYRGQKASAHIQEAEIGAWRKPRGQRYAVIYAMTISSTICRFSSPPSLPA